MPTCSGSNRVVFPVPDESSPEGRHSVIVKLTKGFRLFVKLKAKVKLSH